MRRCEIWAGEVHWYFYGAILCVNPTVCSVPLGTFKFVVGSMSCFMSSLIKERDSIFRLRITPVCLFLFLAGLYQSDQEYKVGLVRPTSKVDYLEEGCGGVFACAGMAIIGWASSASETRSSLLPLSSLEARHKDTKYNCRVVNSKRLLVVGAKCVQQERGKWTSLKGLVNRGA